ncbi:centriolin isoform X1 [Chelonia mydas]|uniref:centriolin isoform X1 n=3 Tax=Chelonia mydas TaxID=8469 RepID=UPI0018A21E61|nr:centriolin isoform X1 [Chelonia mydas]XP_043386274.1 centriolin isoform X1 [Chelonia mydas]
MKKGSLQRTSPRKRQISPSRTPSPMSTVTSSSRSPSPLSRQGTPATSKKRGQRYQQLDVTVESDVGASFEYQIDKDEDCISPGVKYITESLIKNLSKQENLTYVKSLNLSLAKDGGKKFKYIEKLEKCSKLEVLNLSNNQIEKIEKLDKQLKLHELNLSYNKISKIEGLEHMQNLQKLNLAGNEIEHIPVWVGKKLRSLRILILRQNKISSLHDIAKLKPLKDLTSLFLADNPVVNLPHYRLYTIFHLRSLENLDGQPVTNHDRKEALERFNLEEIEKLEKDLEKTIKEMEDLKIKQFEVLEQLQHQDEVNRSLKQKTLQQKQIYKELERDLDTKNELSYILLSIGALLHALPQLKQKTMELTRACQKQYELEQELAFYKIDAKFEPLSYFPPEDVELDDVPGESPYIGKARYKRNMYTKKGYIANKAQQIQVGKIELDEDLQRNQQLKLKLHQTLDVQLEDKEKKIQAAEGRLAELQNEIVSAEQHVLKAKEELKQLQDTVAQKKISEAEKESLQQQLSGKILLLNQLREEALELEKHMGKQKREIGNKQKEIEDLQSFIDSVDPKDPRYAHMTAQKASKEQQLDMMNKHYKQLESRLDEMLSRIARETEEIKDLEQQLTDGQIAANEALKRDLEGIIIGLQEYLESVKDQAKQASDECRELRKDKETLLQRLAELEEERNQLEIVAMDAENMRKEIAELECALQEQREVNESLREAQGDLSAYEAELEAQLKVKDVEANQQKEELERLKQLSQMEHSTLQAELEKERQALENALTKAQISEEKEQENNKLLSQLKQLQGDHNLLKQQLKDLQNQLNHAVDNTIDPEEVTARVSELKRKLQTGIGEIRCHNSTDIVGKSLADLQKQFNEILGHSQQEKEEAWARQRQLQEEMASQQEKLGDAQEKYRQACNKAAEARIKSEKRQNETRVHQLENEIQHLHAKIKSMEEIQGLADQQLQEADEEKEKILAQLEDLENKKNLDDARAQKQILGLDKELKELKRAIATSDKLATTELSIAKDQLKSLHGTVLKINQERAEEFQEAEKFCMQAARAAQDLAQAEAEIELLQRLLKEKEGQFQYEMEKPDAGAVASSFQKFEIDKLNQTLKHQRAEIDRLKSLLDNARAGNKDEIDNLLDEIAALRHALSYQNDYITGIADPFKRRGYWYYMPSLSQVSTPGSPSTKDSGVGLRYPVSSWHCQGRQIRKEDCVSPTARGCWVYSPVRSGLSKSHSNKDGEHGEDNGGDGEMNAPSDSPFVAPPGSVIYTVLPDGAPVPQGTVVYGPPPIPTNGRPVAPGTVIFGPPPTGAQIVYGPVPANFSVPLIPIGVLHCNVPEHHDLEKEISRLEDTVYRLRSQRCEYKWTGVSEHKHNKEMGKLHQNIEDLLHEREELEHEVAELRKTAQKRSKRKDFIEGHVDSLIMELELEKSLKHHEDIVDEIECIEKTLRKRRAELREADRLLAEAETELESTRGKTKETIQKYNHAKQHLSRTETDAEELERRAQEMAVKLVKADQQLRLLQADTRDLEQHKTKQEGILKEINKVVSARDSEFQSLSQKIEILTESLQKLQEDIQVAEGNEDHHLQILKEAENILQGKKTELERLKDQIAANQQELLLLDRLMGQKKEELHLLQDDIAQKKANLKEALREGEIEVTDKRRQIKEVRSFLEQLNAQRGELNAQINEKRTHLSLIKQDIGKEEENLQGVLGQITKHKTELKHILEMLQLENNELQGLKLQHSQKVNELEKTQVAVLKEKLELENLQQLSQCQRGEMEWQRQLLEKDQQEKEMLASQMRTLQNNTESLRKEKQQLEENCQSLERKLSQTKKNLTAIEDSSKAALSNVEKMDLNVRKLKQEIDQLNRHKKSLNGDIAVIQQHLQEKKEELDTLTGELSDSRQQLQLVEQDLKNTTRHQDELLREQATLKEDISECLNKYKDCQERQKRKENQLQQLQREIEERKLELAKQEMILQHLKADTECEEKKLEEYTAKLKDQKQLLEQELTDQQSKFEQAIAKVRLAEERVEKLEKEETWYTALEETVRKTRHQLSEKETQLQEKKQEFLSLQKELELSKAELNHLQDQILLERKKAEKQITSLKEAIKTQRTQLERALNEKEHENSFLQKEMASVERVAHDNHERAKRLIKELGEIQQDYLDLKSQIKTQEDLEKRQKEIKDAVKMLKLEVKDEIRTGLKDVSQSPPELLDDLEAVFEAKECLECELENLKENFPFAANEERPLSFEEKRDLSKVHLMDEQWRGEALREKLRHHEDRLKAQLRQCMSQQVEVLIRGKRQTEGTLHSLKRQVDALDELVSSTTADSLLLSQSSSRLMSSLHDDLNVTQNQVALTGGQQAFHLALNDSTNIIHKK